MPSGDILAVDAYGEEVADACFCAVGWVHDRVCKMVGNKVCVVWIRLDRRGDDEVECMFGCGHDFGDLYGWV